MKTNAWRPWLVGGAVFAAVLWSLRPRQPRFLRLPAQGPAPTWAFQDLAGRRVTATNFPGQVLVLNFWATWCPPCLRELPDLAAVHRAHAQQGLTVLGASIDEPAMPTLTNFLRRSPLPYPVLVADPLAREAFGGVSQVPETWVIDRQGRVAARYLGPIHRAELDRTLAPLLAAPGDAAPSPPAPPAR